MTRMLQTPTMIMKGQLRLVSGTRVREILQEVRIFNGGR